MDISVIIPTYNSADTIQACLDSVLSQSFADYEIIIMDGMSEDNTLDIIRNYGDERIRVYSQKDKGVYDAMNKGIDAANGDWLYFLGSDDRLYDDMVFDNIIRHIKNSLCDVVYGEASFIKGKYFHSGRFDRMRLLIDTNICHQAILYKKEIFSRLGKYNLLFSVYADWDFNIRCFSMPDLRIDYINLPMVYYNDSSGLSNSGKIDENFYNSYPILRISQLEVEITNKEHEIENIYNSRTYQLGYYLLKPIKAIKKRFNL